MSTPDRRTTARDPSPLSLNKPKRYYPYLSPFSEPEYDKINDLVEKAAENAHGFDTTTLNYRNSSFFYLNSGGLIAYAEDSDDLKYGFGFPGHDVAYCTLHILHSLSVVPETDTRCINVNLARSVQLAYRCALTLMHYRQNQAPQQDRWGLQWSFYISNALEAFVLRQEFFLIDYFDADHPRLVRQIDPSWGECVVHHRDWMCPENYFGYEVSTIRNWREGYAKAGKTYTAGQTLRLIQRVRFDFLHNTFFHVDKNTKTFDRMSNSMLVYLYTRKKFPEWFDKETYRRGVRKVDVTKDDDDFKFYVNLYIEDVLSDNNRTSHINDPSLFKKEYVTQREDHYPVSMMSPNTRLGYITENNDNRAFVDLIIFKNYAGEWECFFNAGKPKFEAVKDNTTAIVNLYMYIYFERTDEWGAHACSIAVYQEKDETKCTLTAFLVDPSAWLHKLSKRMLQVMVKSMFACPEDRTEVKVFDFCRKFESVHDEFLTNSRYSCKLGECVYFNFMLIAELMVEMKPTESIGVDFDRPRVVTYSNLAWLAFFGQMYLTYTANATKEKIDNIGARVQNAGVCFDLFLRLCDCVMYSRTKPGFLRSRKEMNLCFTQFHCQRCNHYRPAIEQLDDNDCLVAFVDLSHAQYEPILVKMFDNTVLQFECSLEPDGTYHVRNELHEIYIKCQGYVYVVIKLEERSETLPMNISINSDMDDSFSALDKTEEYTKEIYSVQLCWDFEHKLEWSKQILFEPDISVVEEVALSQETIVWHSRATQSILTPKDTLVPAEILADHPQRKEGNRFRFRWRYGTYEIDLSYYYGTAACERMPTKISPLNKDQPDTTDYAKRLQAPDRRDGRATLLFWSLSRSELVGHLTNVSHCFITIEQVQYGALVKVALNEVSQTKFEALLQLPSDLIVTVDQLTPNSYFVDNYLRVKPRKITDRLVYDHGPDYTTMNYFSNRFSYGDLDAVRRQLESSTGVFCGDEDDVNPEQMPMQEYLGAQAHIKSELQELGFTPIKS